jgi:curved DNA-binding protein CbpA
MVKRDPHAVLGVDATATPAQIKAAWRRLARANHPDLTGDDPAASRQATRRMAEINDAYAVLTRADRNGRAGRDGRDGAEADGSPFGDGPRRRGGPPPPRPTRPVTGRVDTSDTFRPRNQAFGNSVGRSPLPGQAPRRNGVVRNDPPRASTPTGPPVRDRVRHYRRPRLPALADAEATVIRFGKFHDHTLGQIAAFEPSYIDWVSATVKHDPDLVNAARVIQADLDRRGVVRRARPSTTDPAGAGRAASGG